MKGAITGIVFLFFRLLRIHHVDRLPVQEGPEVFRRAVHDPLPALFGSPGDVGGDQAFGHGKERVVLSLPDIDPLRAGNMDEMFTECESLAELPLQLP